VVPEHLDDLGPPAQAGVGADVDDDGAGAHEAVDEVLGEPAVDLAGKAGRPLAPVPSREVDVGVEAVLVRRVLGAEGAAAPAAEIADADAGRVRVRGGVLLDDLEHDADETVRAEAAPGAVRRAAQHRIPGEVVDAVRGQPDAAREPPGRGGAERLRLPPLDRRRRSLGARRRARNDQYGKRREKTDLAGASLRTASMGIGVLLAAVALALGDPATQPAKERVLLGHSTGGRPIAAVRVGDLTSERQALVIGCIHGDECAGIAVTRRLARMRVDGVDLWIVHDLNPDGRALGVRQNRRGVDLNRNFASEWVPLGRRWDPQYSGPRPFSEPEARIARRLIRRLRPDVTLWYHQPQALVRAWGPSVAAARRYARLARVPYRSIRWPNGTAPNWQNHTFPGAASFVVELAAGPLAPEAAARHARAALRLARRP
jgi:murein peptide amidase A